MDRFKRKTDPIVIMGHLGVPTKKMVKGNECFIFYLCGLCSAEYANYFVYVPCGSFGVLHAYMYTSDNSFSCFRRKAFYKSDLVDRFTTSVALIHYLECVF